MITLMQFMDADRCRLTNTPALFAGLYQSTNGDPCTTGCAYFQGGRCPAYLALTGKPTQAKLVATPQDETVRQEAARRGISISEVRRQRNSKNGE